MHSIHLHLLDTITVNELHQSEKCRRDGTNKDAWNQVIKLSSQSLCTLHHHLPKLHLSLNILSQSRSLYSSAQPAIPIQNENQLQLQVR